MVAPSDPRWRAATVGGFTFGGSDPPYCILAVQDGKTGITTIPGQLMGKSLSILHIVVTLSQPTPYGTFADKEPPQLSQSEWHSLCRLSLIHI